MLRAAPQGLPGLHLRPRSAEPAQGRAQTAGQQPASLPRRPASRADQTGAHPPAFQAARLAAPASAHNINTLPPRRHRLSRRQGRLSLAIPMCRQRLTHRGSHCFYLANGCYSSFKLIAAVRALPMRLSQKRFPWVLLIEVNTSVADLAP